ncbi:hypothetical protein WL93_20460 [Burkholderia diffusa]|uniref:hypothetical protein n=1 Tax=Burkholderia diffusa TaxID=488732 RepID=UPI00075BAB69|nr:hypothetical protein [Burkholderia diffusa]KWF84907.1 hypothetical protein WL93_20460 [Burkholderia diffusa]
MNLLKQRVAETDDNVKEFKEARKVAAKAPRQQAKQTRADRERRIVLVGEVVLRRVERREWDDADFRAMMDEALARPADRALFDLDE